MFEGESVCSVCCLFEFVREGVVLVGSTMGGVGVADCVVGSVVSGVAFVGLLVFPLSS